MLSFDTSGENESVRLGEERRESPTYERLSGASSLSGEEEESPLSLAHAKVFPSKLRFFNDKATLTLLGSGAGLFLGATLVAAVIGNSTQASRQGSTWFILAALSIAIAWAVVLYVKYVKARRRYEDLVTSHAWKEGVFVFESGEVVISSSRPFFKHRMNFDRGTVYCVLGNDKNQTLYLTYKHGAEKKQYLLKTGWLVDYPSDIAAFINSNCDQVQDTSL